MDREIIIQTLAPYDTKTVLTIMRHEWRMSNKVYSEKLKKKEITKAQKEKRMGIVTKIGLLMFRIDSGKNITLDSLFNTWLHPYSTKDYVDEWKKEVSHSKRVYKKKFERGEITEQHYKERVGVMTNIHELMKLIHTESEKITSPTLF